VDPASGHATDFQLVAIPSKKGIPGFYALMIDRRGILFSDAMWGISTPRSLSANRDMSFSEIEKLRENIDRYVKENGLAAAPAALDARAVGTTYGF
jgi:hypothetical protein